MFALNHLKAANAGADEDAYPVAFSGVIARPDWQLPPGRRQRVVGKAPHLAGFLFLHKVQRVKFLTSAAKVTESQWYRSLDGSMPLAPARAAATLRERCCHTAHQASPVITTLRGELDKGYLPPFAFFSM